MSKRDKKTLVTRRRSEPKSSNQGDKTTEKELTGLVARKKPVIRETTS